MSDDTSLASFHDSLQQPFPPGGLSPLLTALWWAGKGEWVTAHDQIAALPGANAAWIHAYLHRWEGDLSNAAYWYRNAGRSMPDNELGLDTEWQAIVQELLKAS